LFTAKQLGDLLVGLLAEQADDDGAEVLVARPPQPFQVADHAFVEPDEISALGGPLAATSSMSWADESLAGPGQSFHLFIVCKGWLEP
jgi:hypothetical protein